MSLYYTHMDKYINLTDAVKNMNREEQEKLYEGWHDGSGVEWEFNGKNADNIFTLKVNGVEVANIEQGYVDELNTVEDTFGYHEKREYDLNHEYSDDIYQCSKEASAKIGFDLQKVFGTLNAGEDKLPFCNASHNAGVKFMVALAENYDIMPNVHLYSDMINIDDNALIGEMQTAHGYTLDITFERDENGLASVEGGNVNRDFVAQIEAEMNDKEFPMPKELGEWLIKHADVMERAAIVLANEHIDGYMFEQEREQENNIEYEDERIKISETGRDYDFVAKIENKTDETITIYVDGDYEVAKIDAGDWVGLFNNEYDNIKDCLGSLEVKTASELEQEKAEYEQWKAKQDKGVEK